MDRCLLPLYFEFLGSRIIRFGYPALFGGDPLSLPDEERNRENNSRENTYINKNHESVASRDKTCREKKSHVAHSHAFPAEESDREESDKPDYTAADDGCDDLVKDRDPPLNVRRKPDRALEEVCSDRQKSATRDK